MANNSYTPLYPLINGDTYEWTVIPYDDSGNIGLEASGLDFTVSADIPTATLESPAGVISTATPNLQWSSIAGITGYNLYLRDMTTGTYVLSGVQLTDAAYDVGQLLANGDSYQWWVTAYDSAGNTSVPAQPLTFTIDVRISAAAVPTALLPSGSIANTTPTFEWSDSFVRRWLLF